MTLSSLKYQNYSSINAKLNDRTDDASKRLTHCTTDTNIQIRKN